MSSFDYKLKRQKRKTLAVHILSDGSVEVRAPYWLAHAEIKAFLLQREGWVLRQQLLQRDRLARKPDYRHGAYHPFMGEYFPLHLSISGRRSASLVDGVLVLKLPDPDNQAMVKGQLESWYRQQALQLFPERLYRCYHQLPMSILPFRALPELKIRKMRSRWGSCSSRHVITLNSLLIRYDEAVIDTVIFHELCHLWEFNHSPRFYRLLTRLTPDWKVHEKVLEQID